MRIRMTDRLFDDLARMADELKMYWFYDDYIGRKTVDSDDLLNIMDGWEAYSERESCSYMLTDIIRKAFAAAKGSENA